MIRTHLQQFFRNIFHHRKTTVNQRKSMLRPLIDLHVRSGRCITDDREVEACAFALPRHPLSRKRPSSGKHQIIPEEISPRKAHALLRRKPLKPVQHVRRMENRLPILCAGCMCKPYGKLLRFLHRAAYKHAIIGPLHGKHNRTYIEYIQKMPMQEPVQL